MHFNIPVEANKTTIFWLLGKIFKKNFQKKYSGHIHSYSLDGVKFASNIIKSIKKYSDRGDYVFTRDQFVLNLVTETIDPSEKKILIYASLLRLFASDESRKRTCRYFSKKKSKIVCLDSDFLERIKKNNLIELEHLLNTRYEIEDYFTFDTSQQKYKTGGIADCHIFVLKE